MATTFAQLPLKSLRNGEGRMKYPKIMISNLRLFDSFCFNFMVRVSTSKTRVLNWLTFRIIKKLHIIRFNFMVRVPINFMVWVSITHDRFQLFILSRNHTLFVSFSWFRSQSLMMNFNFLYNQEITHYLFHFYGSGLNHSWSISTFCIIKKSHIIRFIFMVPISIRLASSDVKIVLVIVNVKMGLIHVYIFLSTFGPG